MRTFAKKWLTKLVVFLAMIMVVTTPGSLSIFAETSPVAQPVETANTIVVMLNDDYFNPKVISIPNGKMTRVVLKNEGSKKHTFTVGKLNIDVEVQPGQQKIITVEPKMSGTYQLVCRYHYNEGMAGNVIVN